jgi:hypothetical protein
LPLPFCLSFPQGICFSFHRWNTPNECPPRSVSPASTSRISMV